MKDYGTAIPWIIAAAGWIVANWQANRRETRKEIRSDIAEAAKVIEQVFKQIETRRETDAASVKALQLTSGVIASLAELDMLASRILGRSHAFRSSLALKRAKITHEAFFDLASGDELDRRLTLSEDAFQTWLADLRSAGRQLVHSLHLLFAVEFR